MEKIRFATNYKINIVKKFPFSNEKSILPKYCHFQNFLPKIWHKLDKHLPSFLSSIWKPCLWRILTIWRKKQILK